MGEGNHHRKETKMSIEVGKTYLIEHSRKGPFVAQILKYNGEFIKVKVIKGRAKFISAMNVGRGVPGDVISVRRSFCTFKEVPKE